MADQKKQTAFRLIQAWKLPSSATLGSAIRAKGIMLEVRAHLPYPARKFLSVEAGQLVLFEPGDACGNFAEMIAIIDRTLNGIEQLPVIPREVEDILSIKSAERHRWLKDGRLKSIGTRTVKLRGRAKKITFHVLDPRYIEDVLDRDLVSLWREEDSVASAESRRRGARKAALSRAEKKRDVHSMRGPAAGNETPNLEGWDEFERDGLLR